MIIVMVVMVIIHLSNARPIVCQMSLSVNSDNYDDGDDEKSGGDNQSHCMKDKL